MVHKHFLYVESKKAKFIEAESITVVSRAWGGVPWEDIGQRVQTFSYSTNEFWRSNVQHGDY